MTRAEKSLIAERARLTDKLMIVLGRVDDVQAAIARIDNALAALRSDKQRTGTS